MRPKYEGFVLRAVERSSDSMAAAGTGYGTVSVTAAGNIRELSPVDDEVDVAVDQGEQRNRNPVVRQMVV